MRFWQPLVFLGCLGFYHISEGALAYVYNRSQFSIDSFLFQKEYVGVMAISLLEYTIEAYLFPGLKNCYWISAFGAIAMLTGDIIRKIAMITAKQSFTHQIRTRRSESHILITHGIYRYIRHPGYFGWFIWSISGQILLGNPITGSVAAIWSWLFFKERINYEEKLLISFFGQSYVRYRDRTPTRIPFIQ
eukprot:gb/GECH01013414.1/.p1 GENE.gb/GECH01013414.1/~~gb/GECH01013414.1/.p1  ORF type:complete len:190 (+),score=25.51 gb/GECH01013414.1/:1-570(+)